MTYILCNCGDLLCYLVAANIYKSIIKTYCLWWTEFTISVISTLLIVLLKVPTAWLIFVSTIYQDLREAFNFSYGLVHLATFPPSCPLFLSLFIQQLLMSPYEPGTVVSTGGTAVNMKIMSLHSWIWPCKTEFPKC